MMIISSCYENVEGCLDPDSSNFDVTADIECVDCCTYPKLNLVISHRYGEEGYSKIDTVTNDLSQDFVIEDVQTYISNIRPVSVAKTYRITDNFEVFDGGNNEITLIDDITLIKAGTFNYEIGNFSFQDDYNSVIFDLGVPAEVDEASSLVISNDHPLALAGDSLYVVETQSYVKSRLLLRQVGVHDVADTLTITDTNQQYSIASQKSQLKGNSVDLNLKIDYALLISAIDYNTMTKDQVIQQIGANLGECFVSN